LGGDFPPQRQEIPQSLKALKPSSISPAVTVGLNTLAGGKNPFNSSLLALTSKIQRMWFFLITSS
jgi:hypothetical protein